MAAATLRSRWVLSGKALLGFPFIRFGWFAGAGASGVPFSPRVPICLGGEGGRAIVSSPLILSAGNFPKTFP